MENFKTNGNKMSWIATNLKTGVEYPVTDREKKTFESTGNDALFSWREIKEPPEVAAVKSKEKEKAGK